MATDRPLALITGASSGIGAELALCAAADGYDLALVARRIPALTAVAARCERAHGVKTHVIAADLGDPTASRVLAAELRARRLDVHTLVNNAGLGASGQVADLALDRQMSIIQVNIAALTELTRRLLPAMLARGDGAILNVASTAAFLPGPGMAVYYASKAYVLSFTDALGEELRDSGVRVSALCPGPTATEFGDVSGMSKAKIMTQQQLVMRADVVAKLGWDGLVRGDRVVVAGLRNRLLVQALRAAPRAIAARISARLNAS
ncbi:MAG: SDR family oxidoreductase [Gemmatimonadaceae bacterium]|nr:SDR family oxidoreductase [Gemmatimonadaceae bacterium]